MHPVVLQFLEKRLGHPFPFNNDEISGIRLISIEDANIDDFSFASDFSSLFILLIKNSHSNSQNFSWSEYQKPLANIQALCLEHCSGFSLRGLSSLKNIKEIEAIHCQLTNLDGVSEEYLPNIKLDLRGNPLDPATYQMLSGIKSATVSHERDWKITRKLYELGVDFSYEGQTLHRSRYSPTIIDRLNPTGSLYRIDYEWIDKTLNTGEWSTESLISAVQKWKKEKRERRHKLALEAFPFGNHLFFLNSEKALQRVQKSSLNPRSKASLEAFIRRIKPAEIEYVDETFLDELEKELGNKLPHSLRELFIVISHIANGYLVMDPKFEPEFVKDEDLYLTLHTQSLYQDKPREDSFRYGFLTIASYSGFYLLGCDLENPEDKSIYMFYAEDLQEWRSMSRVIFKDIYAFFDAIRSSFFVP